LCLHGLRGPRLARRRLEGWRRLRRRGTATLTLGGGRTCSRAAPLEYGDSGGRDAYRNCSGQHVGDQEEQVVGGDEHGDEDRGGSLAGVARERVSEHGREDEVGIVLADPAERGAVEFG